MFGKIGKGKLVYRDQERNVILGVFNNKNVKNSVWAEISITVLKGRYKEQFNVSLPELKRLITLINRMPEIKIKKKNEP